MKALYSPAIEKTVSYYDLSTKNMFFHHKREWKKIDVSIVERRLNFHPEQLKIVKDMKKHITTFYRIRHEDSNINL